MKRTLRQTAIAAAVTLVGIELVLQLASVFARPLVERGSAGGDGAAATTILCVGDSHTYGAPLPEEESYPAQLQAGLEARYPARQFRVVNLGIPGVNSTFVAGRLERQILQIRPQLVIVSGGLNNRWNDLHADTSTASAWNVVRQLLLRVKLFRLAAVAMETEVFVPPASGDTRWRHPDHDSVRKELQAEFFAAFGQGKQGIRPPTEAMRRTLETDMRTMVRIARALGVPIMWYNYPAINASQEFVGGIITATTADLGVPVVQSGESMARAVADGHPPKDLFVEAAGPHPTGILYRYIAEDMLGTVAGVLDLDG